MGKVVEVTPNGNLRIYFPRYGEKTLKPDPNLLEEVTAPHAFLDELDFSRKDNKTKYVSLHKVIQDFLVSYPGGFNDEKYLADERNYKIAAHDFMVKRLNREVFEELLSNSDYKEICQRVSQVFYKFQTGPLVSQFEMMQLNDGLKSEKNKELFSKKLFELLYSDSTNQERFESFSDCLTKLNSAKWPLVTFFQFLMFPDQYIFLKPEVSKKAAELVGFQLNYKVEINWLTYKCLLEFANYLRDELQDMGCPPRDMIDVQSFIWCISHTTQ